VVSFTFGPFYPPGKVSGTHYAGGWVGPRAGLDDAEKKQFLTIPGLELRLLGRPGRSQLLYRLCYPGSCKKMYNSKNENDSENHLCPSSGKTSKSGMKCLLSRALFVTTRLTYKVQAELWQRVHIYSHSVNRWVYFGLTAGGTATR
jgi:hypothetical protein